MSLEALLPPGTYAELTGNLREGKNLPLSRCPHCGRELAYDPRNPFRPFCSSKCRLLDLGAWANEELFIPGGPLSEDEDAGEVSTLPDAVRGNSLESEG